ncbi:MAG: cell division protein FtsQ/DivIB, partial [Flavobacteriales bacterium]
MKKLKPLLRRAGLVLGAAGALLTLAFVDRSTGATPISELRVRVLGAEGVHFIDEEGIRRAILEAGIPVQGALAREIDLAAIESLIEAIPCIANAEAYQDLAGVLHIAARQREPVIRVINADGTSFYIDAEGFAMPVSPRFTARVPVAIGWLQEPGASAGVASVRVPDSTAARYRSDELHRLALFLRADPLWRSLFDQVVVGPDGQFELVPIVGGHRILIGDGSELAQRLAKLRL